MYLRPAAPYRYVNGGDNTEALVDGRTEIARNARHSDHTEQFIMDALRRAAALSLSLLAVRDEQIVGHVALSPVSVTDGSARWYGLGPISVSPAFQGSGIGGELMRAALRRLRELGACGCVVLGDPVYYGRFGFEPHAGLVLPGVPPEYFQALPFDSPIPRGVVAYHEAFAVRG